MDKNRSALSLWTLDESPPEADPDETVLRHAIANLLCLRATYRRGEVILAPHIIFTRGGQRFVDAVPIEWKGERPSPAKLETFKLDSLKQTVITSEPFSPLPGFDDRDTRYAEGVIARIDL